MKLHKIPIGYKFKNMDIDIFYIDRRKLKKIFRKKYIVPILKGKRDDFNGKSRLIFFCDFDNSHLKGTYYSPMYVDSIKFWNLDINYFNHLKTIYLYKIFESKAEYLKWKLKS